MSAEDLASAVTARRAELGLTSEDWQRLGKAIADRRFEQGLSQESLVKRGGPSHQTVRNVERGFPAEYRPTTFRKFDRALDWRDGTTEKILNGTATVEVLDCAASPPEPCGGALRWDLLGEAVRARREEMRLPQDLVDRGGPSEFTMRRIERGEGATVQPRTRARLERALRWPDGHVDRILDGTAAAPGSISHPDSVSSVGDVRALRVGRLVLALLDELSAPP